MYKRQAENTYGSLKNYNRSVFLTLGTGIGGAVIINNNLLDCGDLPGCEFGHMIIEKNGKQCNCGKKGCFEKYASMKALKTNLREVLGVGEEVSGKELFEIIRNNVFGDGEKNIRGRLGTDQKSFIHGRFWSVPKRLFPKLFWPVPKSFISIKFCKFHKLN